MQFTTTIHKQQLKAISTKESAGSYIVILLSLSGTFKNAVLVRRTGKVWTLFTRHDNGKQPVKSGMGLMYPVETFDKKSAAYAAIRWDYNASFKR